MKNEINKVKQCVVFGCTNTSDEGKFVGSLCFPCHEFIANLERNNSVAYTNARNEASAMIGEAVGILVQNGLKELEKWLKTRS